MVEITLANVPIRRRLPSRYGGQTLHGTTGAAGLKFAFRSSSAMDAKLLETARLFAKPGAVVWDVGANIGLFSAAAAHAVGPSGQVVAVEADLTTAAMLQRSARGMSSRCAKVNVVCCAVSDRDGFAEFCVAARAGASSHLDGFGHGETGGVGMKRTVPVFKLDSLARELPSPHLVKIDVEGAEFAVLEGAVGLLTSTRPSLIVEVSAANAPAVYRYLSELDYGLFDAADPARPRAVRDAAAWDTLAVPR